MVNGDCGDFIRHAMSHVLEGITMSKTIQTGIIWLALLCLVWANYMFYGDVLLPALILAIAFLAGMTVKGW